MVITNCILETNINFEAQKLDSFLLLCEQAICNITNNKDFIFKLKSATHELIINALEHGYSKTSGYVKFHLYCKDNSIFLEVEDHGKGINIENLSLQKNSQEIDDLTIRGWGLMILNSIFDTFNITKLSPLGTNITLSISM